MAYEVAEAVFGDIHRKTQQRLSYKKGLGIWCSMISHPLYPDLEVEAVQVGFLDEDSPGKPSTLIYLKVYIDGQSLKLCYEDPMKEETESASIPLGKEYVSDLMKFLDKLASYDY
ncbi:hypothetical protein K2Q00_03275 [Patescibacteria group bacterium]|nr:hypothetical protein [Patescibacteria group bacterium]